MPATKDGTPKDKAQRNLTDPESRIQKTRGGFIQGYNAQVVVDEAHQVPLMQRAVKNQGARGVRQLLSRGLEKARGEWRLDCLTRDLLKLYRAGLAAA